MIGTQPDVFSKIQKYLLKPEIIESALLPIGQLKKPKKRGIKISKNIESITLGNVDVKKLI